VLGDDPLHGRGFTEVLHPVRIGNPIVGPHRLTVQSPGQILHGGALLGEFGHRVILEARFAGGGREFLRRQAVLPCLKIVRGWEVIAQRIVGRSLLEGLEALPAFHRGGVGLENGREIHLGIAGVILQGLIQERRVAVSSKNSEQTGGVPLVCREVT